MADDQQQSQRFPPVPSSDHDAIVTLVSEMRQLRTEVKDIKTDIKEVKENVADRVTDLEREKIDKETVEKMKADADAIHEKHDGRLDLIERFIENFKGRYAILAIMGGILVSVITTLIVIAVTKLSS